MTRKDYELIAKVLANFGADNRPVDDRDDIANDLADALAADNPRFNRERFLIAAGVLESCDNCSKRARFFTSSAAYCSLPHAPAWVKRFHATKDSETSNPARTAQESIDAGLALSKSLGY